VIAFKADIASVNFGKNCSFNQALYLLQTSMIKTNCHCHTDHHAERHLLKLVRCWIVCFESIQCFFAQLKCCQS